MHHYLRRYWIPAVILLLIAILIKICSLNSALVERYYASGLYIGISSGLRIITGSLPFSIGDLLYTAAAIWMIVKVVRLITALFRRRVTKRSFGIGLLKTVNLLLIIYIVFYLFWGLNYDRKGIASQLQLQPQHETTEDLLQLTGSLLQKVNATRRQLGYNLRYAPYKTVFLQCADAYKSARQQYPFLRYQFISIKSSMYGTLGDYLGFSGYYNPFSGEAQVNTTIPPFLLPYVTCHEMAHQLGYATEDEANFSGYLAAKSSADKRFQYSVYFDLFNYANNALYLYDSTAAKSNYKQLDTLVKKDIIEYRKFWMSYKNPLEPIISALYGNYLKANNQPGGIETYSKVIAWLIAYQKKYGDF